MSIELQDGLVADTSGNALQTRSGEASLSGFTYLSPSEVQQAQSVGSSSAGATYFSLVVNVGVSMAMWVFLSLILARAR